MRKNAIRKLAWEKEAAARKEGLGRARKAREQAQKVDKKRKALARVRAAQRLLNIRAKNKQVSPLLQLRRKEANERMKKRRAKKALRLVRWWRGVLSCSALLTLMLNEWCRIRNGNKRPSASKKRAYCVVVVFGSAVAPLLTLKFPPGTSENA